MDIAQQKEFYDQYWQGLKPLSTYKIKRVQWILGQLLSVRRSYPNGIKLLDMGCGDGRLLPLWQAVTAGEAYGIELSPAAMEQAAQAYPHIKYTSGDATNTSYADEQFDIIICQEVIEHIEEQHELVKECARILQTKGTLILTTPNKYYFDRRSGGNYSNQPIENIIDKSQLFSLIEPYFKVTHFETLVYAKGDMGSYQFLTNRYLLAVLYRLGLLNFWKKALLARGYGLHLAATLKKR